MVCVVYVMYILLALSRQPSPCHDLLHEWQELGCNCLIALDAGMPHAAPRVVANIGRGSEVVEVADIGCLGVCKGGCVVALVHLIHWRGQDANILGRGRRGWLVRRQHSHRPLYHDDCDVGVEVL